MRHKAGSKKMLATLLSLLMIFALAACNSQKVNQGPDPPMGSSSNAESTLPSNSGGLGSQNDKTLLGGNILVVYFSRTGENYNVGVIEKGNTHIIADMIAEKTGADLFEIQSVNPYPDTYDECTDIAKQEQNESAHPELVGGVENMDQYDTVFIG